MPIPGDGEVLLKIRAAGVCGSDLPRVFTKGTYAFPTIPGHEFAGEVVRVNAGDEVLLGGRFAVYPLLPCFTCDVCQIGAYQQCVDYDYYGSRRDGAFAEYLAVKKWNLVPVPDRVSFEAAAMCEPCAVALHALKQGGVTLGDTVVIFGAGPIGLLAGQAARAWGASRVVLFDVDEAKIDFAKRLGFPYAANPAQVDVGDYVRKLTNGQDADLCLEAVGVSSAVAGVLKAAKRSGRVVLMGNPAGDITLSQEDYWNILRKQLNVRGTWNSSYNDADNDWTLALRCMEAGVFDPEKLISHRFTIDQCSAALATAANKETFRVKVMFVNG
jgi:L-iditol 2-dehydrogenase